MATQATDQRQKLAAWHSRQAGNLDNALDTPAFGAEEQRATTDFCPLPNAVQFGVEE